MVKNVVTLLAFAMLLFGCIETSGQADARITVELGKEFELEVGQSAVLIAIHYTKYRN